jgi:predicted amidophosphoribosyltransferase
LIYPYIGIYQEILTAYKFGANRALARFYAEKMLIALAMLGEFSMENAGWVPVPPKPGKIKAKGWDQIETLAAALVSSPDNTLYMRRCLRRLASQSQKKLDAAGRKINLQGKIRCVKKPPTTAILFDDVHTTGATIQTCAQALKAAGSQTVLALCLYYA